MENALADCRPTVGRQSADSRPTVDRRVGPRVGQRVDGIVFVTIPPSPFNALHFFTFPLHLLWSWTGSFDRILTFSLAKSSTSRLGVVSLAAFIFSRKSERSLRASASLIPTFGQFYNLFRNAKLTTLQLPYLSFSNFLAD